MISQCDVYTVVENGKSSKYSAIFNVFTVVAECLQHKLFFPQKVVTPFTTCITFFGYAFWSTDAAVSKC